jgi:flavin-binding protein dodecin
MGDHVYKKVEIVGSAETSVADAIKNGIERAATTLRNVEWFEVSEVRGQVQGGKVAHFQVVMKVGFRLEE